MYIAQIYGSTEKKVYSSSFAEACPDYIQFYPIDMCKHFSEL